MHDAQVSDLMEWFAGVIIQLFSDADGQTSVKESELIDVGGEKWFLFIVFYSCKKGGCVFVLAATGTSILAMNDVADTTVSQTKTTIARHTRS